MQPEGWDFKGGVIIENSSVIHDADDDDSPPMGLVGLNVGSVKALSCVFWVVFRRFLGRMRIANHLDFCETNDP
jgi:hypothetical protein